MAILSNEYVIIGAAVAVVLVAAIGWKRVGKWLFSGGSTKNTKPSKSA